jgi:hypothetical protein
MRTYKYTRPSYLSKGVPISQVYYLALIEKGTLGILHSTEASLEDFLTLGVSEAEIKHLQKGENIYMTSYGFLGEAERNRNSLSRSVQAYASMLEGHLAETFVALTYDKSPQRIELSDLEKGKRWVESIERSARRLFNKPPLTF